MKQEAEKVLTEVPKPTGDFIIENLPITKRFQTANGMYVHYVDVISLLKKFADQAVESERERIRKEIEKAVEFNMAMSDKFHKKGMYQKSEHYEGKLYACKWVLSLLSPTKPT